MTKKSWGVSVFGWACVLAFLFLHAAIACTNLVTTPSASLSGYATLSYTADGTHTYGGLYHFPRANHPSGSKRKCYSWDKGTLTAVIPEANHTYNVVGNINEKHLAIGETTFGGLKELARVDDGIDYGSLIYIALQRTANCRDAIHLMAALVDEYGYASSGESFSCADKEEAFIFEMISKGKYERGAVWVAQRIPDGHVSGTANQARIRTIDFQDSKNFIYARDVVSFARAHLGYSGTDAAFSFSDFYDPVDAVSARVSEGRVWSIFNHLSASGHAVFDGERYVKYIRGEDLTDRMPFSVPVTRKLSLDDIRASFRQHNEGTVFDNTKGERSPSLPLSLSLSHTLKHTHTHTHTHTHSTPHMRGADVGAGPFSSPYRWRPLVWTHDGDSESIETEEGGEKQLLSERAIRRQSASGSRRYANMRTVSTQQTSWHFTAVIRADKPMSVMYWAPDDTCCTPMVPILSHASAIPQPYAVSPDAAAENPISSVDTSRFSFDKMFWVSNMVANLAYSRWSDVYPKVKCAVDRKEKDYDARLFEADAAIEELWNAGKVAEAEEVATRFSVLHGTELARDWLSFYGSLFQTFHDGDITTPSANDPQCNCEVEEVGYSDQWRERIVDEAGNLYALPDDGKEPPSSLVMSKESLPGV